MNRQNVVHVPLLSVKHARNVPEIPVRGHNATEAWSGPQRFNKAQFFATEDEHLERAIRVERDTASETPK